ncbi:MAG: hypothetical protein JWQ04_2198 [Pedosphaera sp.]|nr:hypothetical protein [Pedosphaera sp.]
MKSAQLLTVLLTILAAVSVAPAQTLPTNGLVAYYPFNANANDASGNLHDGVLNGDGISFTADRFGSNNAAAHLGGGGYISISPTPFDVNADYSISFWIKLDNSAGNPYNVFSTDEDNQGGLNVRVFPNNSIVGWAFIPAGPIGIDSLPPTNYTVWHSIVCVHQDTNDFLYIDNSLMAAGNHSGTTADTGSIWIGRHQSSFTYDLQGAVDDVRFYGRALSNSEVAQLYAFETIGLARAATATAVVTNGFVVGATVTDGGFGYTNAPVVRVIGGGGSGAQLTAVVSNGVVVSFNVSTPGIGYTGDPLIVIEPPFILNPVLKIAPMSLLVFSNLLTGTNYQLQSFRSNIWVNESISVVASGPVYTQLFSDIVDPAVYRLALKPAPLQAFATPQIVNGFLVGATITSRGSGYVSAPFVNVVGGSGSNATAIAQIGGGAVTNIQITSAGIGYTNHPTLQIAPPPAGNGISPTIQAVMRVDATRLAPYDNYQVQFKPDLSATWSNYTVGVFTPTDVTNSQLLLITNNMGYFRLQYVP